MFLGLLALFITDIINALDIFSVPVGSTTITFLVSLITFILVSLVSQRFTKPHLARDADFKGSRLKTLF